MIIYANLPMNVGESGLTIRFYNPSTGTQINAPGDVMLELSNGVFYADVTQDINTDLRADVYNLDGDIIASDFLYLGNSIVGLARIEEDPEPVYTNVVRRNANDDNALFFEWPEPSLALSGLVSLNGGDYVAVSGPITYLRTESGTNLYSIGFIPADRPASGVAEYKISDGVNTRIIPLSIDSGGSSDGVLKTGIQYKWLNAESGKFNIVSIEEN